MSEKKPLPRSVRGRLAVERAVRETWTTGLPRYSQLIVMRGRIRLIPSRESGVIHTELWGSGCCLNLHWFADELPPGLRDGAMATVVGNVQTYNLNDHVAVQNCMLIPKYGPALGRALRALVAKYALSPKTYVGEEQMDKLSDRIMRRTQRKS